MTPERWVQVRELFESALDQDASARSEYIKSACGEDRDLMDEVHAMVAAMDEGAHFLENPMAPASSLLEGMSEDAFLGMTLGPWKLLRRIGQGGTSAVYAAARTDNQFNKIVAIKVLKPGMDFEEIIRRFRTEQHVLAGLEHPNIARLLDGGSTATGLPYLVMEYVEGVPIDEYCNTNKLGVTERLQLFRTVCSAVQYAHQNLVVHRDLKPANILVSSSGDVKLLDFGIAKLLRPEYSGMAAHFTRTQMRMMTPEYASPEQVRGEPISTASDVYSLGVILYQLMTGDRPYKLKTRTAQEIEEAVCKWDPEKPSSTVTQETAAAMGEGSVQRLVKRLHGDLDMIVLMALRKEPLRRYASVEKFSEDVGNYLKGMPVSAAKDTWRYRVGKFTARHRAGVAIAALVTVALVSSTAISTYFARQARRQKAMTVDVMKYILLDFDRAVLDGTTKARKESLDRLLAKIGELSPDAGKDPELRSLLFNAYLRVGDIQGNAYSANLGDPAGASDSYRKAVDLARTSQEIALAKRRIGDIDYDRGDYAGALKTYLEVEGPLEAVVREDPKESRRWLDLTRCWYRIGFMQSQLGRLTDARSSFGRELEFAQQWFKQFPDQAQSRRERAAAEQHFGDMYRQTGDAATGLTHLRGALSEYEAIQKMGDSAAIRNSMATVYFLIGEALRDLDRLPEAAENYRQSMGILRALITQDPNNARYKRQRNVVSDPLAKVAFDSGDNAEARRLTQAALNSLKETLDKPDPYDLYLFCWILVTTPLKDLHDPKAALLAGQKAAELTSQRDPGVLDAFAQACAENGDAQRAIEIERKALGLYPDSEPTVPKTKRARLTANLARFEQAARQHP